MVLAGYDTINTAADRPEGRHARTAAAGSSRSRATGTRHEHALVPRPHVQLHAAERLQGQRGDDEHYSALDRGNEAINDGVNLRLPSGTAKDWGNLDYDVNLMVADKAWDQNGQLFFDIFNTDGFLGDVMTVNFAYKPYFEVERRKYRFRILNGCVARFLKIALVATSRATPSR